MAVSFGRILKIGKPLDGSPRSESTSWLFYDSENKIKLSLVKKEDEKDIL